MDRITNLKAEYIVEHGYEYSGYILTHPETGKRAFVERGRVMWLDKEPAELILGHTPGNSLSEEFPARKKYTLTEGASKSRIETPPETETASDQLKEFRERTIAWLRHNRVIEND